MHSVTFVSNHDVERSEPIINDKFLAYAFILTHEGVPCTFWQDFYKHGLALPNSPHGIDRLCRVCRDYAGGNTSLLYSDEHLYIAQRHGYQAQKGLVVVINIDPNAWRSGRVQTAWPSAKLTCVAWCGRDKSQPYDQHPDGSGCCGLYAAPRG
ncbi:MAG TPA: hypothetical protein VHK01_04305, partial [Lacipirellulaceae bacterium]|nr:hypothetical protein [Lacipirellulaceae bacterium]